MNKLFEFFRHNNARIGQTLSLAAMFCAGHGWVSLQSLEYVGMVLTIWGCGSWMQGYKQGFKPPVQ